MSIKLEDIYRCLLDKSADGIIVSCPAGLITNCNSSIANLVGKKPAKLIGEPLSSIVDLTREADSSDSHARSPTAVFGQAPPVVAGVNQEETLQTVAILGKDGSEFLMPASHVEIRASGNGAELEGFLTIVYILQASTVQQAQTEFVSTVSHELRTPLTSIKGFADTILRAGERLDVSQQRRYVGIIKDQADRLTRLVEDLLAVSRLESKRLQLTIRAIDLEEAVDRVRLNLSEKASSHKIEVKFAPGIPPVWADADRLEQILTNLMDNAIKYSTPDTTVTVTAKAIQTEGQPEADMVECAVSDQGVGISQESLPKIFSKFSRLDNPLVRQTEGTGLGLYITRSLVLALGGEIDVRSQPGKTTFTVRLPAASLEQQAARGRDFS
ncbi:MAG: PAS domain-containing sensor histidine kinase [Candidatus Obscuribacterales bacterium]|nr:PAS domain-containing sensor histidine kinase [Candidatus Obscuribacterales bacterium]